ncbi:unnamed protein product [Paramecium octaurelia]|uniref:Uncharacterized protein n=1 Tax=Paramecium octaurelia TaxID=43137 RepID=A0A8S1T7B3_PAROT|nr:unnamed protein product [Paramecium octaurelia]
MLLSGEQQLNRSYYCEYNEYSNQIKRKYQSCPHQFRRVNKDHQSYKDIQSYGIINEEPEFKQMFVVVKLNLNFLCINNSVIAMSKEFKGSLFFY